MYTLIIILILKTVQYWLHDFNQGHLTGCGQPSPVLFLSFLTSQLFVLNMFQVVFVSLFFVLLFLCTITE